MASRDPVEAPEGTEARPMAPDSSNTSHSTVGLPRESRISRPMISTIALMVVDCPAKKRGEGEKPDCIVQIRARRRQSQKVGNKMRTVLAEKRRCDPAKVRRRSHR